MSISDLVAKGFGGYSSWNDNASADADFKATGGKGKETSGSSGSGVAGYGDAYTLLGQQKANNATFLAGQNAQTSDYLNRYKTALSGQESMSAMAKRLGTELNLPTLSENAYNINKTVRELPQTYNSATRGFDVNANQLSRIIGQKTSELAPALTTANEALANAQGSLNTQLGYGQADNAKALLPFQTEKELLTDRLARETTLYTRESENELNVLIEKIKSGIAVSEAEKNRANELAQKELDYKLQKQQLDDSARYKTVSGGGSIYDTVTGKIIDTAPKISTGGSITTNPYSTGSAWEFVK